MRYTIAAETGTVLAVVTFHGTTLDSPGSCEITQHTEPTLERIMEVIDQALPGSTHITMAGTNQPPNQQIKNISEISDPEVNSSDVPNNIPGQFSLHSLEDFRARKKLKIAEVAARNSADLIV